MNAALEIRDLEVRYGARGRRRAGRGRVVRAVDGLSLTVGRGEIVALVGESGCGKTTVANAVMRLVEPSGGSIRLSGEDITALGGRALRTARRRFQMIFQDPYESLDPRRTVGDTVRESLAVQGIGQTVAERDRLVLDALEQTGLRPAAAIARRYPHQLSGGQRQRVAIAAAMALRPELIVADEPVSMLDVSLRAGVLKVMQALRTELGIAYLFITHDLSLAWMFADRIAVLYLGRIVEQGPAADVIGDPKHPYTRALVSVIPSTAPGPIPRTVLTGETPDAADLPTGCRFHPRCPRYRELDEPQRCRTEAPILVGGAHHAACHFPHTGDPDPNDRLNPRKEDI